jgi:uncharacterized protein (DUF1501 family)
VIIGGEFGRTPAVEITCPLKYRNGGDHNSWGFSSLVAGGSLKGGTACKATDDFGFKAVDKPV